jgi:hypothetical protein
MIKLDPHKTCPFGSFCDYKMQTDAEKCRGLDPNRPTIFICELWAENYPKNYLKKE